MEDLDTLRLMAKLVPEYCQYATEAAVSVSAFDLIFAFDEVITCGHKESVTLQQIRTYFEMDSHEEKLQKIIQESKMNEARDQARRKAESIDKEKSDRKKVMDAAGGGGGGGYGYGGGGGGGKGGGGGVLVGGQKGQKKQTTYLRQSIAKSEKQQFAAVLGHGAFQANPLAALRLHLQNQLNAQKVQEEAKASDERKRGELEARHLKQAAGNKHGDTASAFDGSKKRHSLAGALRQPLVNPYTQQQQQQQTSSSAMQTSTSSSSSSMNGKSSKKSKKSNKGRKKLTTF